MYSTHFKHFSILTHNEASIILELTAQSVVYYYYILPKSTMITHTEYLDVDMKNI